jgi:hypothetical protein
MRNLVIHADYESPSSRRRPRRWYQDGSRARWYPDGGDVYQIRDDEQTSVDFFPILLEVTALMLKKRDLLTGF